MHLNDRVVVLERELRHLKSRNRGLVGFLLVMTGIMVAGSGQPGEPPTRIRTRGIIVEDDKGRPKVVLGCLEGNASIGLFDDKGVARLAMSIASMEEGPAIVLADEAGRDRLNFGVQQQGPGISVSDEFGRPRVTIDVVRDGMGLLCLDADKDIRAALLLSSTGPSLTFYDDDKKIRWKAP